MQDYILVYTRHDENGLDTRSGSSAEERLNFCVCSTPLRENNVERPPTFGFMFHLQRRFSMAVD